VAFQQNRSEAAYSVSATGAIAYRASRPARRQAIWVDRSGRELGTLGEYEGSSIGTLELEPHGKRVAFSWTWTEGNTDIYVMEADQSTARRFTLAAKADFNNIWSPDGSRIVFSSDRNGSYDLYQKLSTGAGPEEALLESRLGKFPSDWSPDGRFLLYWQDHPETQNDLWVLPMDGDRKPRPFVEDALQQLRGRFSPDGKWVAYQSNENGRLEIYVQAFPGPGGKWLVSTGHSPRWARSGNELHYLAEDGTLMTAPIRAKADVFEAGTPTALFQTRLENRRSGPCHYCMPNYDVDADGRFLMTVVAEEPSAPINLILNWPTLLKK
jgi:Tol biopolymer transport system component